MNKTNENHKLSNIVTVKCLHFWSDWTEIIDVEINLDKYVFFSIEWRGINSWHIVGHRVDENHKWSTEELSEHTVNSVWDLADFIVYANTYPKSIGKYQDCKVSRFNNLHYYGDFYKELSLLLKIVECKEKKSMEGKNER